MKHRELVEYMKSAKPVVDDQTAVRASELYPMWTEGKEVATGERYQHRGRLYKVIQAHTTQADWQPDITPAMWMVIDVEHLGTEKDPIPWEVNMECFKDKIYIYNDTLYRCIRDSEIALAYTPDQLIENYFEVI